MQTKKCNLCGNVHFSKECSTIQTRFQWKGKAKQVYLVGSWSNWLAKEEMIKRSDNIFFLIKMILQGQYQYKYIVDGSWSYDPSQKHILNSYGNYNNIVKVELRPGVIEPQSDFDQETTDQDSHHKTVLLKSLLPYSNLKIKGSWDNWSKILPCTKYYSNLLKSNINKIQLNLEQEKQYEFKFIYFGEYIYDPTLPMVPNQFGGMNNRVFIKHKQQQNKINNRQVWKWEKISLNNPTFQRLSGHSICQIAGKIYIFGGRKKGEYSNQIYVLNQQNYQFFNENTENSPAERGYCNTFAYGSKMIVYGGVNSNKYLEDYYTFNVSQKGVAWLSTPLFGQKPQKRQKNSFVVFDDCLIIYGGYYASQDMETQIYYDDIYVLNLKTLYWSRINPEGKKPEGRHGHKTSIINRRMYLFGGLSEKGDLNDVWSINLDDQDKPKWRKQQIQGKYPTPRHGHTMIKWEKNLLIFGGKSDKNEMFNDLNILNLKKKLWMTVKICGEVPAPRYYHAWEKIKNNTQIIVFGGITSLGKNRFIYRLKPITEQQS